jgi:hypothetical protein
LRLAAAFAAVAESDQIVLFAAVALVVTEQSYLVAEVAVAGQRYLVAVVEQSLQTAVATELVAAVGLQNLQTDQPAAVEEAVAEDRLQRPQSFAAAVEDFAEDYHQRPQSFVAAVGLVVVDHQKPRNFEAAAVGVVAEDHQKPQNFEAAAVEGVVEDLQKQQSFETAAVEAEAVAGQKLQSFAAEDLQTRQSFVAVVVGVADHQKRQSFVAALSETIQSPLGMQLPLGSTAESIRERRPTAAAGELRVVGPQKSPVGPLEPLYPVWVVVRHVSVVAQRYTKPYRDTCDGSKLGEAADRSCSWVVAEHRLSGSISPDRSH